MLKHMCLCSCLLFICRRTLLASQFDKGELTASVLLMLNLSSTFSMSCSCDIYNLLDVVSHTINIPKIFFADPKYFIAKDLLSCFFNVWILALLLSTIKMSLTWNKRVIESPTQRLFFSGENHFPKKNLNFFQKSTIRSSLFQPCSSITDSNYLVSLPLWLFQHIKTFL